VADDEDEMPAAENWRIDGALPDADEPAVAVAAANGDGR
jgi:hypothetical protein